MPVNQPPISEDLVMSSWQYETTRFINELEQIIQRGRSSRGPEFLDDPELGQEHYLTDDYVFGGTTFTGSNWYKYDTEDGWIQLT